jgi:hypothetical protein
MTLYCGKCKKLMYVMEFVLPTFYECPECGFQVYEASDY